MADTERREGTTSIEEYGPAEMRLDSRTTPKCRVRYALDAIIICPQDTKVSAEHAATIYK